MSSPISFPLLRLLVTRSPGTFRSPTSAAIHREGGGHDSQLPKAQRAGPRLPSWGDPPPYSLPAFPPSSPPKQGLNEFRQQQPGEMEPLSAHWSPRVTGGHGGRGIWGRTFCILPELPQPPGWPLMAWKGGANGEMGQGC